jgi:hypothetical protein
MVTLRGFKAGWKHGAAYLGHMGASLMLIGVIASSGYGSTRRSSCRAVSPVRRSATTSCSRA